MLIGQAGDKITECIVINKSFKIINNFNNINCMLMILNFNLNFICVLFWKNCLLFYQITSILVKFKSAKIFFQFVTCAKIRAGFVDLWKKQITLLRQSSQSIIQKNMFWEKSCTASFIIGTRRTKVAKRDWIYKLYFLNFKMFFLCRKYNLLYLFYFYQRYFYTKYFSI